MTRDAFRSSILAANVEGSGKASSYLRALDLLSEMIRRKACGFEDCEDIWAPPSVSRLEALHQFVLDQQAVGDKSIWRFSDLPPSYLANGFCSAALRSYEIFLVSHLREQELVNRFREHDGDEDKLVSMLDQDFTCPSFLTEGMTEVEGKEVLRTVRTRTNQQAFRRMVMTNYSGACCITGLEVPEVNRASHIIPWGERKETRMDPRNGLLLSATYDAAFDRCLLSLDDDYRIILSKDLKAVYSSVSFTEYFLEKEGLQIHLPLRYLPSLNYLAFHRNRGSF